MQRQFKLVKGITLDLILEIQLEKNSIRQALEYITWLCIRAKMVFSTNTTIPFLAMKQ